MNRIPATALAVLVVAACAACADPLYRMRKLEELSDRRLSPLGVEVLKGGEDRWAFAESLNFIGYTPTTLEMDALMRHAEFANREIAAYLDLPPVDGKIHLFLVENDRLWAKSMRRMGVRPDGLACQVDRELYLKYDYDQNRRPDRVAHEVVHARLRAAFGKEVPLWLDEGLANYYGWRIARQYARRGGTALTRKLQGVPQGSLMLMDPLTGLRSYPESAESAQAFYRQSEELLLGIHDKIGDGRMAELVRALSEPGRSFRAVMQSRFGFSSENLEVLERTVRERSVQEREE